jgi:hypothetical protein
MLELLRGCPVWEFEPRIGFGKHVRLDAQKYGIKLPSGLPEELPEPQFIEPARMVAMLHEQQGGAGGGLSVVHGLTVARDFAVSFQNPARQWRKYLRNNAPPVWQFQGGVVYIDITIDIFILEGDRPSPGDALSGRIFAIIMEHELLHVLDEIDIVTTFLPARLAQDGKVRRYLSDAMPVDEVTFRNFFQTSRFSDWLKNDWADEHNRRQALRDAPAEYAKLQQQIDDIRVQMINRPAPGPNPSRS